MSIASQASKRTLKNKTIEREDLISQNVNKIFQDKNDKMIKTIIETMSSTNYKLYKQFRKEMGYDLKFLEIDKERSRLKRKKNK